MELSRESMQDLINRSVKESPNIEHLITIAHALVMEKVDRKTIHTFLDIGHLPQVNSSVVKHNRIEDWLDLLIELITKSKYSFGHLLYHRARRYKEKVLFKEFQNTQLIVHTYDEVWNKVLKIARALTFVENSIGKPMRVGVLTSNSLHGALIDLACLSFHFTIIPIPANASDSDIEFIVKHSGITHIFLGGEKQTHWYNFIQSRIQGLTAIKFESTDWISFLSSRSKIDPILVLKRINRVDLNDIATIMYTSGTTGEPKGITFTQKNFMVKRFARALALPEIGPNDSFLCYLPLYHTFGRYFELQGSIFWGASYTFAQDSSYDTLRKNFLTVKPTVFISVPRRWTQLYETIQSTLTDHTDDNALIRKAIKKVTGGQLKWGISAAGYLDPDIFKFFQSNDVSLLSGYGMTEATGGITMTSPNDYMMDSVGNALPGIKLRLSEEGELLLKGPYISKYYYDDPLVSTFQDGWFHTGDIFTVENGHYFIQDRKKEIYKNAAGQTITPQKIENMLQEFDAIESAFLVGDRMDFNTVLIYPNREYLDAHFPEREPDKIRSSIGALIQSINGFLARYERMVNFAIIHRNFTIEKDELTQKGTYKRKNILDRWSDIIQPMYLANQTELDSNGKCISFPNWFFKKLKIIPQDISWSGRYLKIKSLNKKCKCIWQNDIFCLGDFIYTVDSDSLNIEHILLDPRLWLGNQQLVEFAENIVFQLIHFKKSKKITISNRTTTASVTQPIATDLIPSLKTLHTGTLLLGEQNLWGFDLFNALFENGDIELRRIGIDVLESIIKDKNLRFSQKIFNLIIPYIGGTVFLTNLRMLFKKLREANKLKTWKIDISKLKDIHVEDILLELVSYRKENKIDHSIYQYLEMLFQLSANVVQSHPKYFSFIRHELTNWVLLSSNDKLIKFAESSLNLLDDHLKSMIPKHETDTQEWKRLIQFEKSIEMDTQTYLIDLFQKQSILFETIFILSGNRHINLDEIGKEEIWISQLYKNDDYFKYRVLLTLQDGTAFNFIISYLPNFNKKEMKNLSRWQISMSSGIDNNNLTNNFIAYWPDQGAVISEYDHGSDVYWYLKSREDEINDKKLRDRWDMRWLHFGWSSLQGYIDYLTKTDFNYALENPSIKNVIVSEFDNATHVRIKQSFKTEKVNTLVESLIKLYEKIIISTEKQFRGLNHVLKWEVIFTCILQSAGTKNGLSILEKIRRELNNETHDLNSKIIQEYIEDVTAYGYLPKPVVFAALRFHRWMDLNKHATLQAQSEIIQELYKDYKLHELYEQYPAIRFRFFLLTCFPDHESDVAKELFRLSSRLSNSTIENDELETRIHVLINNPNCSKNDAYFLTRLIYHQVEPSDFAELIHHDTGFQKPGLVVIIKDKENKQFCIRQAYKPKEMALFHDQLLSYNLYANFTDEHEFLLLFSPGNKQCGGIYWKFTDEKTAHLEKIAIDEKYQGGGLGERLLNECLQRLKMKNVEQVTVAFMKSEFFQYHGFKTDANFAGLVKKL